MALWQRVKAAYGGSQYGFVKYRRREQALLLIRLMLWTAAYFQLCAAGAFWDARNAFPSVSWTRLDRGSLYLVPEEDADFVWLRYHRVLTVLGDGPGGCLLMQPMEGDRQGDGGAAHRYIRAMDGPL